MPRHIFDNIPMELRGVRFKINSDFGSMSKPWAERDRWFNYYPIFFLNQSGNKAVMTSYNGKRSWTTTNIIWVASKPNGHVTIHTEDGYYSMFPDVSYPTRK